MGGGGPHRSRQQPLSTQTAVVNGVEDRATTKRTAGARKRALIVFLRNLFLLRRHSVPLGGNGNNYEHCI